ncbi:MAG: molecular chaperone TorD family protein [Gaiellaceae bacterium]|nr:molecular chaperone TorD family protein [Gaiellaceae bacterium]
MSELLRALAVLSEPPSPECGRIVEVLGLEREPTRAEWTELLQLELPPYASIYLGNEGQVGGEARDRVAGFWRALGLVPPAEPDHLAALLGLYAEAGEVGAPEAARRALLWEHLLAWLPVYLAKAREIAPRSFQRWAELLEEALLVEAERLPSGGLVPLHLREAGSVPDPREDGADAFLDALLAPVRSGLLLTRADLRHAARDLHLGLRVGERSFVLRSLLAQDAEATLRWLAAEAEGWAERHRRHGDALSPVGDLWAERAERAAELLDELAMTTGKEVARV